MSPSFVYGGYPVSINDYERVHVMGADSPTPIPKTTARPLRMSALEYIAVTGAKAIRNGNTALVVGPLHPKQRNPEILKLPR